MNSYVFGVIASFLLKMAVTKFRKMLKEGKQFTNICTVMLAWATNY